MPSQASRAPSMRLTLVLRARTRARGRCARRAACAPGRATPGAAGCRSARARSRAIGQHRADAAGRDVGGADRVCHARDDLEAAPQPGRARAGVGVQAEVEHLRRSAGEEHRHVEAGEQGLGGARDRGGLAARVVADDGQRAAGARDADEVAVAQRVGGPVEARRLAVPHAEHAVVLRRRVAAGQLAAPRRGRAELLVEAGHVAHEVLARAARGCARAPGRGRRAASPGSRRSSCRWSGRGAGRRGAGRAPGARAPGRR